MVDIDDFKVEVSCEYKGEMYSVRDNGSIMRHPKNTSRVRPWDNKWTFGIKCEDSGYMFFASNVRVHQVVATAFWGHLKAEGMVVDHKDTNRCNNRAENLHWVTRLENVLNNPYTRRKIIFICGSISAFLENPSMLGKNIVGPNFKWMRVVSKKEAERCKLHLERWSKEDTEFVANLQGNGVGEWIFSELHPMRQDNGGLQRWKPILGSESPRIQYEEQERDFSPLLVEALTPNVMQKDWKTPSEFPLCPHDILSLETYYSSLEKGKVFSSNRYGMNIIIEAVMSIDKKQLCVVSYNPKGLKPWNIAFIYIYNGKYVHENGGSFFEENGALKMKTIFQGKEWTSGDCIDDYC